MARICQARTHSSGYSITPDLPCLVLLWLLLLLLVMCFILLHCGMLLVMKTGYK